MPEESSLQAPLLKPSKEIAATGDEVPHSKRSVQDLRDFTAEFIERGYHAEYASWRDGYLKWRKGDHKGAKGENDDRTHALNRTSTFEYWYPTVSSFTFRRTCSYWITVLYVEGCLLFLWQPLFVVCWPHASTRMLYYLTKVPVLIGTTIFGIGIYMGYVELINMDTDTNESRANLLWCDWRALLKLLQEDTDEDADSDDQQNDGNDSHRVYWYQPLSSIAGWIIYLLGAVLFQIGNVSDMFSMLESTHQQIVEWPLVLGGFCFFLGGVCELLHNRVWATPPTSFVWWASMCNFIGGIDFWLCACPSIVGDYSLIIGVQGTVLYLIGAVLGLCMWRGEQFGLSLIGNLNRVHRSAGTQIAVRTDATTGVAQVVPMSAQGGSKLEDIDRVVEPKLSWRGLLFVLMCVLCGTSELLNVCQVLAAPWEFESSSNNTSKRHIAVECISSTVNVFGVHLLILLNSVCVHVPSEQPYRLLTQVMRLLLTLMTVQSIIKNETLLEDEFAGPGSTELFTWPL